MHILHYVFFQIKTKETKKGHYITIEPAGVQKLMGDAVSVMLSGDQ